MDWILELFGNLIRCLNITFSCFGYEVETTSTGVYLLPQFLLLQLAVLEIPHSLFMNHLRPLKLKLLHL